MQVQEQWPHGATVKLEWDGPGPYGPATGWAKRDADGKLVSAFSLIPLDEDQWNVVEERLPATTQ